MGVFSQNDTQNNREPLLFPEPPKTISTKDLSYFNDMLNWNLIAAKKMRNAAKQCKMPDIRKEFESAEKMHSKHYNEILQYLQDNSGGGQQ